MRDPLDGKTTPSQQKATLSHGGGAGYRIQRLKRTFSAKIPSKSDGKHRKNRRKTPVKNKTIEKDRFSLEIPSNSADAAILDHAQVKDNSELHL